MAKRLTGPEKDNNEKQAPTDEKAVITEKGVEKIFPGQFIPLEVIRRLIRGDQEASPVAIGEDEFDTEALPEEDQDFRIITPNRNAKNEDVSQFNDDRESEPPPPSIIPRDTNRPPERRDLRTLAQFHGKNKGRQ